MNADSVLDIFKVITTIPRESGHEAPITAFLQEFAFSRGLSCKTDPTGNVLISRPASKGRESVPALVLQCHQDMVCEKNPGVEHDFAKDPIKYVVEDGWMVAKDTTLGADDGIGIAACLALLESDIPTGPLECLFTISEETGMDGAEALQSGFFSGKTLINLDSEDEGEMFIGCAGGLNSTATLKVRRCPVEGDPVPVLLRIGGCLGGHSGDDINKERVNAVQQMARFLYGELQHGLKLVDICGGGKPNAIARDCTASIYVSDFQGLIERFAAFGDDLGVEYHNTDPGVFAIAESSAPFASEPLVDEDAARIVTALFACPHGVEAMSQDIPGLVETSTNLASVRFDDGYVTVVTSQRSSTDSQKWMIASKVEAALSACGAKVVQQYAYPGWRPNVDSHILKVCVESYKSLFGHEPKVKAIHAGLECGLFLEKFPDLDMISFGPTLRGVHAPGERLELKSLEMFTEHLVDVVKRFA